MPNISETPLQICQNIRNARELAELTQEEIAVKIGVGRSTYAGWEKNIEPNLATLSKISEVTGVPLTDLIKTDTESYTEKRRKLKNDLSAKDDLPVFVGNTRAGTITIYSDDPSQQEPVGHLSSKLFPGCNHAEKINGDSMYPLAVNQGLAIGKVIDKKGIVWGEKYIIHTVHGQAVLKYVHPSMEVGHIKIVSHNKKIPEQDIPLDDITFCCRVYFLVNPT